MNARLTLPLAAEEDECAEAEAAERDSGRQLTAAEVMERLQELEEEDELEEDYYSDGAVEGSDGWALGRAR